MRLLFDQNLSRHLVRRLAVEFPGSEHVTDVGLDTATDTSEILDALRSHRNAIVAFSTSADEALLVVPST